MREDELRSLLEAVQSGRESAEAALARLRDLPFADLGVAHVDHHRALRVGMPEVIFCEGKTAGDVAHIAAHMAERGSAVLGTRCSPEVFAAVQARLPRAVYNERGRVFRMPEPAPVPLRGRVAVVTAGTSDLAVAEEAMETLRALGAPCESIYDVGVAGLHRLMGKRVELDACSGLIVVAGMEGALPSVVGGLSSKPIVGVPTSVGYGVHLAGLTPLFAMLTSCASGLVVVNVNNGFGAAMAMGRMFPPLEG